MFIKKLSLKNFQKHSDLTLEFTSGVNYIYGSSDAGKSCIRRAIGFLFFGDPRTEVIRKEGTKQTSVLAIMDNEVEVERIKSSSINRYIVRKDGQELIYDSIGASIPKEVQQILQVSTINIDDKEELLNLNIEKQITLPFLSDKSPAFRNKLFNILTGNDVVDKIIQNLNKEMLGIGRDIKSEQEFIETNEPRLQEVTIQHSEKAKVLGNFQEKREILLKKVDQYKKLVDLQTRITTITAGLVQTQEALQGIKIVPEEIIGKLKGLIDKWIALDDLQEAVEANKTAILEAESALKGIKIPEMDILTVRGQIERLKALQRIQDSYLDIETNRKEKQAMIQRQIELIVQSDEKYSTLLKEAGVCPVCKQDTSKCGITHG